MLDNIVDSVTISLSISKSTIMLSIIQRVKSASVTVSNERVANIQQGVLVLVCVEVDDNKVNFEKMINKLSKYRIFEDDVGKMNLSLSDICGEIILVPQFTLAASTSKGNRPSFSDGCPPDIAKDKFQEFVQMFKNKYDKVQAGVFGADMQVALVNDGPVTFSFKV